MRWTEHLFTLLDGLSQMSLARVFGTMLHDITCTYGLHPVRAPHAQHMKFGGHRVRDQAIVKKECILHSYAARSKVATHWIEEVYADTMQLCQQPSYTVQFAEDLAIF